MIHLANVPQNPGHKLNVPRGKQVYNFELVSHPSTWQRTSRPAFKVADGEMFDSSYLRTSEPEEFEVSEALAGQNRWFKRADVSSQGPFTCVGFLLVVQAACPGSCSHFKAKDDSTLV